MVILEVKSIREEAKQEYNTSVSSRFQKRDVTDTLAKKVYAVIMVCQAPMFVILITVLLLLIQTNLLF